MKKVYFELFFVSEGKLIDKLQYNFLPVGKTNIRLFLLLFMFYVVGFIIENL